MMTASFSYTHASSPSPVAGLSATSSAALSFSKSSIFSQSKVFGTLHIPKTKTKGQLCIVALGMLAPRKFMQKRKKIEVFKDKADEKNQKNWRKLMLEIEKSDSAVAVLRNHKPQGQSLPRDLVLGTLKRFKQMKKWNLVSEILEWLTTQCWWNTSEMDFLMLITAYGKLGDFNRAERVLRYMNKKGYPPSVISHTALMEAYGRAGQYNKAEATFRRMKLCGPEPSPVTYQIILKAFVEGERYDDAEAIFQSLLNEERSSFKPDQKMFHMMIYMYKKAGRYDDARKLFGQMAERGVPQSTVTFNSLMSFETDYKEVSKIYDQMQRADIRPDVVSYALLIYAYGKARREAEALAVFEEMLDAGVRPTRKAYNILLNAFAISGMVEEARTVFKSMRRDRCYPDLCSYATMLSAFVNASDMEGAENFFRRIKQDGLEPNQVIYGTLMKGYAMANNCEKMMKIYENMRLNGIKANQTIFTTIMDAYGRNTDFGSAVIWFKEMVASGFLPDKKAKNVLLSLAKTMEEQAEANELVGNTVVENVSEDSCTAGSSNSGDNSMTVKHLSSIGRKSISLKAKFSKLVNAADGDSDENEYEDDEDKDDDEGFEEEFEDDHVDKNLASGSYSSEEEIELELVKAST